MALTKEEEADDGDDEDLLVSSSPHFFIFGQETLRLPEVKSAPGDPGVADVAADAAPLALAARAVVQPPHVVGLAASPEGEGEDHAVL